MPFIVLLASTLVLGQSPALRKVSFADAMSSQCFARADVPSALAPKYDDIVRRIYLEVWRPENNFRAGDTVASVGRRLRSVADKAVTFSGVSDSVSDSLLRAETVVAWIRSNMEYWTELNQRPGKERVEWNKAENVMSHSPRPKGNCDGYSKLAVALSSAVGVECVGIGGCLRSDDGSLGFGGDTKFLQGVPWNHGWNAFLVGNKLLPADITGAYNYRETKFRTGYLGKTDGCLALPMDREEWEIFLGRHRMLHWNSNPVDTDPFTSLDLASWKAMPVNHVAALRQKLRDRDIARNRSLSR